MRRSISNHDTTVSTEGEPLPEEAGIDTRQYYMRESEAHWRAFGATSGLGMPTADQCQAIYVIDRTDYSHLAAARTKNAAAKKPWWKFW